MAEIATSNHAYCFTLTYADVDGIPPLGARVYRYKDVSDMWKRIRQAAWRRWGERVDLRYVVVGEKGTQKGRCHYHGVLFSSHPIVELGKIKSAKGDKLVFNQRLDWSLWGHGFVEFQKADRKGVSYAVKYILKSRMTAERSRGTHREGKTEWLASSYLWCSKVPPVGGTWLWRKLKEMVDRSMCPSDLRIRVPGGGDWYVGGELQKEMCLFLHRANEEYRAKAGRDLAGFRTLVASVEEEMELADTGEIVKRKPWEWLTYGETLEQDPERSREEIEAEKQQFEEWYVRRRNVASSIYSARATLRNCGHIEPCEGCRADLGQHDRDDLRQEYLLRFDQWKTRFAQGERESASDYEERFREWWLTRLRPSRGCLLRDSRLLQEQFGRLVPLEKARPNTRYKAAIGKSLQDTPG